MAKKRRTGLIYWENSTVRRLGLNLPCTALALIIIAMSIVSCSKEAVVPPGGGSIGEIDYVNVRDEPQHRHEFENDLVRIYDVVLPPGYVTLYHAHIIDTVYLVVQGSRLKSRSIVGSLTIPLALPVPSGMVFLNEHTNKPLIHEVANAGKIAARLVGLELKQVQTPIVRQPISGNGLTLRETYEKIRVYDIALAPGESTGKIDMSFSGVIIALSEATVSQKFSDAEARVASFEPASWAWYEKPGEVILANNGVSHFEAVLYEFP